MKNEGKYRSAKSIEIKALIKSLEALIVMNGD